MSAGCSGHPQAGRQLSPSLAATRDRLELQHWKTTVQRQVSNEAGDRQSGIDYLGNRNTGSICVMPNEAHGALSVSM